MWLFKITCSTGEYGAVFHSLETISVRLAMAATCILWGWSIGDITVLQRERAQLCFAETHPHFRMGAFWSHCKKILNPLGWMPLYSSIFPHDLHGRRKTCDFKFLAFRSFQQALPLSQQDRLLNLTDKASNHLSFVFDIKAHFCTDVWLHWQVFPPPPRVFPPPLWYTRFCLTVFEFAFTWKRGPLLQKYWLPRNGHENAAFCVLFHAVGTILELQRMFEHSNIIRLRFSRTNFFYERTFVDARWSVFGAHIAEQSFGRGL